MNYVHKRRLLKMADFLGKVPSKHFHLDWFTQDVNGKSDGLDNSLVEKLNKIKKDMRQHTCGAIACAVGWIPAIFPLTFQWNRFGEVIYKNKNYLDDYRNFSAARQHLVLNNDEIGYLFLNSYYPVGKRGPKSVAARIKEFVKTGIISDKKYA